MDTPAPTKEHLWLGRLIGDWTFSYDAPETDDARTRKIEGTETFRAIGALWVQGDGVSPMSEGGMGVTQMTLGWDPTKGRFVGCWLGTMLAYLWVYDGELDSTGQVLTLYAEGPAMDGSGRLELYKDVITFLDDNTRTLTGHTKGSDGNWKAFTSMEYRRR